MAAKKGKKRKTGGSRRTTVVVAGKKRHHKRRKSTVGATHRKKTRRKKKGGFLGATGGGKLKNIAIMAVGVGTGAAITHIVLRPVEKKLVGKWPMVGKFLAAGEVFLGGMVALHGKGEFVKSLGVGILAGGVHGLMKQADIYKEIPRLSGSDDGYSEIRVPISGSMNLDRMLAGILNDSRRDVYTQQVAGFNHTAQVAGGNHTSIVAGDNAAPTDDAMPDDTFRAAYYSSVKA